MLTTAQLAARKHGLGASELAAVLGLSPFASPWDVWSSKRGLKQEETGDKPWLTVGSYLERGVADWYQDQAREKDEAARVISAEAFYSKSLPLIGPSPLLGSPDRIVVLSDGVGGLEAKTSRTRDGWGLSGSDQVHPYIAVQCHIYLKLTGFDWWDIAAYFKLIDGFDRFRVDRSEPIMDELQRRAWDWWDRYIIHGEEPPIDGSDGCSEAVKALFPRHSKPLRHASEDETILIREVAALKAESKDLEDKVATAENRLKSAIGHAEGIGSGHAKATWKSQERSSLDTKAFKADHPDLAKTYEKTTSFRVLRVTCEEE